MSGRVQCTTSSIAMCTLICTAFCCKAQSPGISFTIRHERTRHTSAWAMLSEVFAAGCVSTKSGCGINTYAVLPRSVRSATLTYRARFSEGYSWTAGGKLLGLCSHGALCNSLQPAARGAMQALERACAVCASNSNLLACMCASPASPQTLLCCMLPGCNSTPRCVCLASFWFHLSCCHADCPVGCEASGQTYSSRIMWRREGQLVSYVYLPGKSEECGVDWDWPGAFAGAAWRTITYFVQMNDAGAQDPQSRCPCICLPMHLAWLVYEVPSE